MRALRTMLLLVMAAVTAMALASTASAQGPDIEVASEPAAGQHIHCGAVTTGPSETDVNGGCLIHAKSVGEVELRKHVFGIESHITRCENEFHGRVSEHGEGFIFEQQLIGHPAPNTVCGRLPCTDPSTGENEPWPAHGKEGMPTGGGTEEGSEYLTVNFCVKPPGGSDESCEIEVPFQSYDGATHRQEFGHATEMAGHGISGFRCELLGHWNTETGDMHDEEPETDVEVEHWTEID